MLYLRWVKICYTWKCDHKAHRANNIWYKKETKLLFLHLIFFISKDHQLYHFLLRTTQNPQICPRNTWCAQPERSWALNHMHRFPTSVMSSSTRDPLVACLSFSCQAWKWTMDDSEGVLILLGGKGLLEISLTIWVQETNKWNTKTG